MHSSLAIVGGVLVLGGTMLIALREEKYRSTILEDEATKH